MMKKHVFNGLASIVLPFTAYAAPQVLMGSYQRNSYLSSSALLDQSVHWGTDSKSLATMSTSVSLPVQDLDVVAGQAVRELVVLDAAVPDKQVFLNGLKPGVKWVEISADEDGVKQLQTILSGYRNLDALHIVSHGEDGQLQLGNSLLTLSALEQQPGVLRALRKAVKPGGDLLLFGCNVAKGVAGNALMQALREGTGLDIQASNDATGSAALGADWDLEIALGSIETDLPFSAQTTQQFQHALASFSVSSISELRSALSTAASNGASDTITITGNISATGSGDMNSSATDGHPTFVDVNITDGFDLEIVGGSNTLDANYYGRVLEVRSGTVTISDLTLREGLLSGDGGDYNLTNVESALGAGIRNAGSLTISSVTVTSNGASGGGGSGGTDTVFGGGGGGGGGGLSGIGGGDGGFGGPAFYAANSGGSGTGGNGGDYTTPTNNRHGGGGGSTIGGVGGSSPGYVYGAAGGAANNGSLAIGGGGGGAGYSGSGSAGGSAVAGIYNSGALTLVNSTISNNVGAGGGGGGGASSFYAGNGGNGGRGVGGVWNTGTFFIDASSSGALATNTGAGGYGGNAQAPSSSGSNGASNSDIYNTGTQSSVNSDATLTASGTVSEPIGLDTTIDTVGEALNVFDFTLTDGGTSDGLAMTVSQVVLNVSGTSTDTERAKITWRLNGNDVSNVSGSYDTVADTITFSDLTISIANNTNETYTVNAYYNDNTGITEDTTVILSVDGDTDLTVGGAGTQMASTSAVTNSTGTTLDVVATQLAFTTQPAGSVSGSALSTQPVVTAQDAFGNTDVDFTETVTVTEASAGSLASNTVAASSGVATFSGLAYTATADQQSFTLTADDQSGVGTDLSTVDASAVTSDVVATKLIFSTQPAPLTVNSGDTTAMSTVPVVTAVDASDVVDTGYSTGIALAEVNGAGSAVMTGTGDTDGSSATVTITPSSGVSTFTSLGLTYTASGGSNENFNLQASSGALTTATSSQITAVVDSTPPTGYSVSFDQSVLNASNAGSASFVISNAEVGATYSYLATTSGGGGSISSSGNAVSSTSQAGSSSVIQFIQEGTITLSVTLTDAAGNVGTAVTDTILYDKTAPVVSSVSVPSNGSYGAGDNLDFTVNADENITVNTTGGTPQLSITVGATTRQATYQSGSGSSALLFRYTVQAGENDADGIAVGSLSANGGTLSDGVGNPMTLTLNSVASTASVLVDTTAPSGHSVSFDDSAINSSEAGSTSFTFASAEVGAAYSYTITSSGGGGSVNGSGTISGASQQITGVNVSGLGDGTLTLSVVLTDSAGNAATAVTDTTTFDDSAPTGHSVSFDDSAISSSEAGSTSFTFASAEVGAAYSYTITSSGGGGSVNGSGTISSASQQITGVNVSGLGDGTLTLSVVLTDSAGNAATAVTDTTTFDDSAPTGHSVSFDDSAINNSEASSTSFTFAGAEVGAAYSYTITSSGGGGSVNGSGTISSASQQITGVNVSGLGDGTLTLSVVLTDSAGNAATAVTDTSTMDAIAPTGHSVSFDDSAINSSEAGSTSFTFASAEVGAAYSYSISSSGGGSAVTGSGTISSASQQISAVDVSGLGDGTLTLSVVLTDSAGNAASAVTDTTALDASAPSFSSSSPSDGDTNVQYNANITLQLDENVSANSGNISIFDAADDSLLEAISVASASVSGSDVTVNPSVNFTPTHTYYVQVDAGALVDSAGNSFAGISDKTTLNFTVVNNAPSGTADSDTTNEDNAVAIDVLANDSDSDSSLNPASVTVTNQPANGSVSVNTGTGVITYTPDADYNGSDSFTYTVDDLFSGTSSDTTVSVTINAVNDAPVAVADVVNTAEDTAANISVGSNDTDVDTADSVDTATISLVTQPTNGSAVVSAGQVVYTPDTNYNGSDSFTYQIDDQNGATSNVATVMINVSGVNDAPVASDDSGSTDEDNAVNVNLISNDTDVDGTVDVSSVSVVVQPANGSVSVDSSGLATYTPDADYNGSDSFTYVVQDDGTATSNVATVTITINSVNDAPVASNDTVSLQEDTPHNINALGNDSDVDGTVQSGTLELVASPANGSAVVSAGVITYTPGADFNGSDSLSYRVQDDLGEWSNTATVAITVQSVNDNPLANNDSATTDEDTAVIISVLANDSDVDGTLDNTSITIDSAPSSGSLTDNGDGTLTYTPTLNTNGSDSFSYSVLDNEAASSNSATVSITVQPVNDAPTISGSPTLTVLEGAAYSFTPTLVDVDDVSLTVSVTNLPSWLSLDSATGALTGTPQVGDAGDYTDIVMSVTDSIEIATLATFSITVEGDNDTDGTADSIDTDDDNDGMSDSYEQTFGFNPLDAADAAQDLDGDSISNLQDSLDHTDPNDATDYTDITAPIVTAPADLVIDATGLYTSVPLYQLLDLSSTATDADLLDGLGDLVYDNVDGAGCCDNVVMGMTNNQILLAPGSNTVTYRAVDRKGNQGTASQIVDVRPLVSVNKDQVSAEGATVQFRVILNGQSPFYPLTVPYVIDSASTTDASDHDLVDGSVVFTSGQTTASVSIALTDDMVSEGSEVLIVRLDDQTTNAQDLAAGYDPFSPDIYDINSGAKNRHQITVTEDNVAPDVALQLSQNSVNTVLITAAGGMVTITATVTDPNSGDSHTLDWSASDAVLVDTDGDDTDATLVFDPSGLASGVYKARITAADGDGAEDTATLHFQLVSALPTLGTDDSDGDGTDDATEGTADSDDDGIPDYLDNISASNVLPEQANQTDSYLMECEPGVRCRVGQYALQGNSGGARVEQTELTDQGVVTDTSFSYDGGIFDFEIHNLPTLGQSVQVVLPQVAAIPDDAVYRKLVDGSWQNFVSDANNEIHSAAGNLGFCPPPGDDSWQTGLTAGDYCVQLTIEDGGPNDADGLANGSIEDPSGVGVLALSAGDVVQTFPTITSTGKGSGGAAGGGLLLMLAALARRKRLRSIQHLALALLATAGFTLLPTQSSQAAEWNWDTAKQRLQERGYVALALYQAKGSQGQGDFQQGMVASDVSVTLQTYDVTRTAYQFALGYRYHDHMALELGYLDLGDVDVDMSATGTSNNLKAGLDQHYPVSGDGFTVSNRFLWPVQERTVLSAEVGLYLWDGDIDLTGTTVNPEMDGGTDFLLGVAAHYELSRQFAIGVQLKRVFFDDQEVDLMGVEGSVRF
jgi:hypothetical protein